MSEAHKVWYGLIRKVLSVKSRSDIDADVLYSRIHTFFAMAVKQGQHMLATIDPKVVNPPGNKIVLDPITDYVGHVTCEVRIPMKNVNLDPNKCWITYSCTPFEIANNLIAANVSSAAVLIRSPGGVSVVSDIDDTIKDSFVADKTELLLNTFCRPFKPVRGMSSLYNYWSQKYLAQFHYVSGSPWQLATVLNQDFLVKNRFPQGSIHLRTMYPPDFNALSSKELVDQFFDTVYGAISGKGNETSLKATKQNALHLLHKKFPTRKFILVGDTGEWDAEIYGDIARQYPGRTMAIFIRRAPIVQVSEDLVIKQISVQKGEILSGLRLLVSRAYHFLQIKIGKVTIQSSEGNINKQGKMKVRAIREGSRSTQQEEEMWKSTRESEEGVREEEYNEKMTWVMSETENYDEWVEKEVVKIRVEIGTEVIGEVGVEMAELRGRKEGEGKWVKREWSNGSRFGEVNVRIGFYDGKQLEEERWKDAFRGLDVEGNKVTWKIFNDPEELADCEFYV